MQVFMEFSIVNLGISDPSPIFVSNFQYIFVSSTCETSSINLLFASHFKYFVV